MIASLDLARFPLGIAEREALALRRAGPLARWEGARERLSLTLRPVQSFGSWGGEDPLGAQRTEAGPGPVALITHSRTRARDLARFFVADGPVVRALEDAPGRLWSDGFVDDLARLDSGTLSLWRDTAAATAFAYAPGVHQSAVKAQRDGGWFTESWFARFAVEAAAGSWRGVPFIL